MTQVRLTGIHKTFHKTQVIKGIDLEVRSGEFMVFVGPSGCGKSTLLRLISGLEELTEGEIFFDDKPVGRLSPSNRKIAMVFQSYALYPHMNVYDNIAFGMKLAGSSKEELHKRVMAAADMLQIGELLKRLPKQLSGGQRQRVAIGRAIVRDPTVFLFDEPLSNLDAALRVATRLEIASLKRKMPGTTMIYVTHDQVEAMTLADRICVLRDGLVEQVGTPMEMYEHPETEFVAGFIGSPKMNFLHKEHAEPHGAHTIGIRPEDLEVAKQTDHSLSWKGEVLYVENVGSDIYLYIDINEANPLVVRLPKADPDLIGQTLVAFPRDAIKVHRFDKDGRVIKT